MRFSKLTFTTRYVLLIGILLLIANTILGLIILNESKVSMKKLINKNMLDVVQSAAATIDGDKLGALTKKDEGGREFKKIAKQLTVFKNSVDIKFIYAVKQVSKDKFVFTVDPDPVDPGAFGEEVLVTEALIKASKGDPYADDEPAADRWGNFYSAYCPVYDSAHRIAGIIGIDYSAQWYDYQMKQYTVTIMVCTILTVVIGSFFVFLITNRVRRRFSQLSKELSDISSGVDMLMNELSAYSGFTPEHHAVQDVEYAAAVGKAKDELEILTNKMHELQDDMGQYLDYMHNRAFTDALTMVSNASAYHEKVDALDERIKVGKAEFTVIVFDLNSLKQLNDNLGHECGDMYLHGAAVAISGEFGEKDTYRIGGDEFAVILENTEREVIDKHIENLRNELKKFRNKEDNPFDEELSLAIGISSFDSGIDSTFADVFGRADKAMYEDKKLYYEKHDRRRGV
jgi:diguanylate cyclase (GGDEF)-like protein